MKNYLKTTLLVAFLMILGGATSAQTFKDYGEFEEGWLKVFVRYSSFNSTYTPDFSGFTVNLALRKDKADAWAVRTRYESPTLGDFIYAVANLSKDVKNGTSTQEVYDDHAHGGGFLGWGQAYINVYSKGKLIISPGITGGDYIFGNAYNRNNTGKKDQDPRGYYIAVGPAIMASYAVNKLMWVDAYINYDITLGKTQDTVVDENYPNPSFLSIGADLNTEKRLYGGFRLNKIIDKGYNNDKSSRLDISVGFCF